MIRALLAWLVVWVALPAAAQEESVVLGMSQNRVQITARFDGSEILIFGAVKRETPIPDTPLDVVITVAGPSMPVTVHRKDRRFGIWVNAELVEIDHAPSFYAVATSGPVDEVLSHTEDLRHQVTVPRAVRSVGSGAEDPISFTVALIRIRRADGTYQTLPNTVEIDQQTLFDTNIALPSNLIEGSYAVRVFLMREGRVVSDFETAIEVRKAGLERWIYNLAQENALIYGILSLIIAVAAGWAASAAFRAIRG
ncbi:TIGR02186 family protein [Pseudooceanicola sp. LIPI14-2-Ac024]|uniref:TIGR02186 family protein n=1 Tax=Pseudooceanicola sp. LIPI14-2-Ac024 TaxID=3344875 RepID=UPI0035CF8DC4